MSNVVELKAADLDPSGETSCPNPKSGMARWNSHPRVYLKISDTGHAKCPYCGTEYRMAEGEVAGHGH